MEHKKPMGLRLSLLHRAFMKQLNARLQEQGLTGVQFGVLCQLDRLRRAGRTEAEPYLEGMPLPETQKDVKTRTRRRKRAAALFAIYSATFFFRGSGSSMRIILKMARSSLSSKPPLSRSWGAISAILMACPVP